jgi:hypothetical protein
VVAQELSQPDRRVQDRHIVPVTHVNENRMAAPPAKNWQDNSLSGPLSSGDETVDSRRRGKRMVAENDEKGLCGGRDFAQSPENRGEHAVAVIGIEDRPELELRDNGLDRLPMGAQDDDDIIDARPQDPGKDRFRSDLPAARTTAVIMPDSRPFPCSPGAPGRARPQR